MKQGLVLLLLFLVSACSNKPYIIKSEGDLRGVEKNPVYIVSHGWHTGLVVPAYAITQRIPALARRFADTPYLEFGWGDRGFYQADEITSGLTLRAILWPSESVVHAVALADIPGKVFPASEVIGFCLSDREYAALVEFIENSFYKSQSAEVIALNTGIYGDSQFYQGMGDYYLMNTCNKWTAKGLASAGFDISTLFKLTASSVMGYLQEIPSRRKACISGD